MVEIVQKGQSFRGGGVGSEYLGMMGFLWFLDCSHYWMETKFWFKDANLRYRNLINRAVYHDMDVFMFDDTSKLSRVK